MAFGITTFAESPFAATGSQSINVALTGFDLTVQENTPAITGDANVSVTGQTLNTTLNNDGINIFVGIREIPVGIGFNANLGSVTTVGHANVSLTGQSMTIADGTAIGKADFNIEVTGQSLTSNLGSVNATANSDAAVTGFDLTSNLDSVSTTGTGNVSLTGELLTATEGTLTLDANTFASVTGEAMTAEEGTVDPAPDAIVTGQEMTSSLGSVSVTANADVQLFNGTGPEFSASGNAALSTDQAKFGASSLELDGTDDFVDSTSNINLSSTDFTVDLWIRPDNVTGYKGIWQSGTSTTEQSYLLGNQVYWTVNPSTIITTSVTVSAGVWTMLSYERQGNTHRIYKNGTLEDTVSTGNKQDNGLFSIGKNGFGDFDGYIDEVRVSDIARYGGSSFTEPTSAFSVDSDTIALLHFDGADGSTDMINALNAEALVLTSNDGTLAATGTAEISLTGELLSITEGNINVAANADVVVTGQELTMQENAPTVTGDANVTATALPMTTALGTAVLDAVSFIDVTGQEMTIQEGQADATDSVAKPTGIAMTMAEGSVIGPIIWNPVPTGNAPIDPPGWKEVA
jgi:hypothetical protein